MATRPAPAPAGAAPSGPALPRAPGTTPAAAEVAVPNLVGARLEAARRDLAEAGLRLGQVTGPADGFVVKQTPEAGASVPRDASVHVTLSATAAGVTVPPSQ
jgi:beta-lactam-binding protein with PASTA domain